MVSSSKVLLENPFAKASATMAPSSNHSASSSDDGIPVEPAPTAVLQAVSIRSHVPVALDIDEGNYGQWRYFFDSALSKFGLEGHVRSPTPSEERNGEWRMVDSCVVNWTLTTVYKGVFDILRQERNTAFSLWHAIEGLFLNNELREFWIEKNKGGFCMSISSKSMLITERDDRRYWSHLSRGIKICNDVECSKRAVHAETAALLGDKELHIRCYQKLTATWLLLELGYA